MKPSPHLSAFANRLRLTLLTLFHPTVLSNHPLLADEDPRVRSTGRSLTKSIPRGPSTKGSALGLLYRPVAAGYF